MMMGNAKKMSLQDGGENKQFWARKKEAIWYGLYVPWHFHLEYHLKKKLSSLKKHRELTLSLDSIPT